MTWESGVVTGLAPIATYRRDRMTYQCFVNKGYYIIQFHNGRQTGRVGYTRNKHEANQYILKQIRDGFKKVQ